MIKYILGALLIGIAVVMIMVVNEPLKDRLRFILYWAAITAALEFGIYFFMS